MMIGEGTLGLIKRGMFTSTDVKETIPDLKELISL